MSLQFTKGGWNQTALYRVLNLRPGKVMDHAMARLTRTGSRKLVSPRGGRAPSNLVHTVPKPPADDSLETAGEILEAGLMMALIDAPFGDLEANRVAIRGAELLAQFPGMTTRPGVDGLFRLNESETGDRVSRFFQYSVPMGWGSLSWGTVNRIGRYGNTAETYAALQAGNVPEPQEIGESTALLNGRSLASLVHQDWPFLIPLLVSCQLFAAAAAASSRFPVLANEAPFVSYGGPVDLQCAIAETSRKAMQDCWYVKWNRDKRERPERLWREGVKNRLHPAFLEKGQWLVDMVGPYLPMPYAEGSPIHPDYPSGHAVLAGVGFTLLKAYFADGPVPSLNIENLHTELDKAAWAMSVGRCWAGIHTRSSLIQGLALGEQHAIRHLKDLRSDSIETLAPTSFVGFQGNRIITV